MLLLAGHTSPRSRLGNSSTTHPDVAPGAAADPVASAYPEKMRDLSMDFRGLNMDKMGSSGSIY